MGIWKIYINRLNYEKWSEILRTYNILKDLLSKCFEIIYILFQDNIACRINDKILSFTLVYSIESHTSWGLFVLNILKYFWNAWAVKRITSLILSRPWLSWYRRVNPERAGSQAFLPRYFANCDAALVSVLPWFPPRLTLELKHPPNSLQWSIYSSHSLFIDLFFSRFLSLLARKKSLGETLRRENSPAPALHRLTPVVFKKPVVDGPVAVCFTLETPFFVNCSRLTDVGTSGKFKTVIRLRSGNKSRVN